MGVCAGVCAGAGPAAQAASADDSRYTSIEDQIASPTSARDALATQIRNALDDAAFGGHRIREDQARDWFAQAQGLLIRSAALAAMT